MASAPMCGHLAADASLLNSRRLGEVAHFLRPLSCQALDVSGAQFFAISSFPRLTEQAGVVVSSPQNDGEFNRARQRIFKGCHLQKKGRPFFF